MILVSVDDHVVEPPDLFDNHLPARYRDAAPRLIRKDSGADVWTYEGREIPNIGLNAVAGRPPEEYGIDPASFDQMRPGCFEIGARVDDMNANGVLGAMCFPSFPQFAGQLFGLSQDKDVGLAMVRAYNDWHIDEWCGSAPGRFIPLSLPPVWDPQLMADEVRRVAAKGCHAVTFSENPEKMGFPSLHSEVWNPFWEACVDEQTVVCLHIGSSSELIITSFEAPIDVLITLMPVNLVQAAADLIWSGVLRRYPGLRVALSEGGIGWIPYFLERIDYVYDRHHRWTGQDFGKRHPSDIFREQVITCFIDDQVGLETRSHLNLANVCWECDYPHSDSTWPHSPEVLARSLGAMSDAEVNAITHENAMRLFSFDPFTHRPREECTVSALRAEGAGVDVSPRSVLGGVTTPTEPVRIADLVERVVGAGG